MENILDSAFLLRKMSIRINWQQFNPNGSLLYSWNIWTSKYIVHVEPNRFTYRVYSSSLCPNPDPCFTSMIYKHDYMYSRSALFIYVKDWKFQTGYWKMTVRYHNTSRAANLISWTLTRTQLVIACLKVRVQRFLSQHFEPIVDHYHTYTGTYLCLLCQRMFSLAMFNDCSILVPMPSLGSRSTSMIE
jgi:hypothetical protein